MARPPLLLALAAAAAASASSSSSSAFSPLPRSAIRIAPPPSVRRPGSGSTSTTSSPSSPPASPAPSRPVPSALPMSAADSDAAFRSALSSLESEGVPLLACDAAEVHTLCAALWTTMSELSESTEERRACLVLESIPMDALVAFADDFTVLKGQPRLMANLPELARLSVSVAGRGAGPAVLLESSSRTPEETAEFTARSSVESTVDEGRCLSAMRTFVERAVVGLGACPYTRDSDVAAIGLESLGVPPGPVGYRLCPSSDACSALGAFWNAICELQSKPQDEMSTAVLSMPAIGTGTSPEAHDRFAAVAELMGRNLCLFRGDSVFNLVHFHPSYDRDRIFPPDGPAYGHLPPRSWMRPILRLNGNEEAADTLSDDEIALSDYQRRAPHAAVNILRVSQLSAAAEGAGGGGGVVDLTLDDGSTVKASGIGTYSRNAIRMAGEGRERLEDGLMSDIAVQEGR